MNRTLDFSLAAWRKSTYSDGGQTNCVEVCDGFPGLVPIRDSKVPTGPTLAVTAPAWTAFLDQFRSSE
ncbi:DUF397 domain-containing protein [Streptomyces sp. AM 2-1-1]|uniref:DUF397 domain-containing protein n=1 Tax=unclassified Streptomyces TaxID=2593676 RepID=UPI0023B89F8D|nr:DUF397 domain-containing protein [Streptomyces sp. AM 2-1-1]WEH40307.1 DUF397 domain-containing protein [Streptomyces sp. AM 2-1-1]